MSIFDKLNFGGIGIGAVQSVDEMTVVPIIGGDRGDVAEPTALSFRKTSTYGTMVFENTDDSKPAIIPTNTMVRGPGAQDHAMSSSGIVLQKSIAEFDTACCIEQSQGGYLRSTGNEMDILPVKLRKDLTNKSLRRERSYDKLWPKIKKWLANLDIRNRHSAHLRFFYDEPAVKKNLEEFAAEFEPIENQIGAIIMFSGVPVGIEIMPTAEHWKAYWKWLLRGCYGAELLRLKMLKKIQPTALILPEIPAEATLEEAQEILEAFSNHLQQEIIPILENISIKSARAMSATGDMQINLLTTTSGGGGDLIEQDGKPVYLSLVL